MSDTCITARSGAQLRGFVVWVARARQDTKLFSDYQNFLSSLSPFHYVACLNAQDFGFPIRSRLFISSGLSFLDLSYGILFRRCPTDLNMEGEQTHDSYGKCYSTYEGFPYLD